MPDIVVTTPKSEIANSAREAADVQDAGGGSYFRTFRFQVPAIEPGERVYYVEDGYVRGYAIVSEVVKGGSRRCDTTGRDWGEGVHVLMDAQSWQWITPIPMRGFQAWRYWRGPVPASIGGWLDPRPAAGLT